MKFRRLPLWGVVYIVLFTSSLPVEAQPSYFGILADSALRLTKDRVNYDPSYFSIAYPMGDIPVNKGVCTDVIIRTYRKVGVDLQVEVHNDMVNNFEAYPALWGLASTDKNIDHRRVPNLMTYFSRQGAAREITLDAVDYLPGDIVAWSLGGGITHIGIMADVRSKDGKRFQVIHNIGGGQILEDCLLSWKIIGHYRFMK